MHVDVREILTVFSSDLMLKYFSFLSIGNYFSAS